MTRCPNCQNTRIDPTTGAECGCGEHKDPAPVKAGWTPGPWRADVRLGWVFGPSEKGGEFHVAQVRGWGYFTGRGEGGLGLSEADAMTRQNANLALIASSPALAEALEGLLSRLLLDVSKAGNVPTPGQRILIKKAEAALRLARGEG